MWFVNVRRQLERDGIDFSMLEDLTRVFNLDETAIYTNSAGKVSCWYLEAQNLNWTTSEKYFYLLFSEELLIAEKGKTGYSVGMNDK